MRPILNTLTATGLLLLSLAAAAEMPSRPVRLVVPSPAGGTMDGSARALANALGPLIGQPIIVENRVGAAGIVAASYVSRAEPDGTTLFLTSVGPSAITPAISKAVSYDPVKDFTAISLVSRLPFVLVATPGFEARNVSEVIAQAKANPGKVEYASAGTGSVGHLLGETFASAAGISLLHVPYQGQAPSVMAVVAGEVKLSFTSPSPALYDMIRTNKMRLIGVSTREPSRLVPGGVPIAKVIPNFNVESWYGIVGPAHLKPTMVTSLNTAIQKALADPAVAKQFELLGSEVKGDTPAQFRDYIASEVVHWRDIVRAAHLEGSN